MSRLSLACLALVLGAGAAEAKITKLEILSREPAFGGASFGATGGYDRLLGRAEGVLDPADPANAIIQDLTLAPRNADGLVNYATAIEILKPHDIANGNRVLLFETLNRGNKLAIGAFDLGVECLGHAVQAQLGDQRAQLVMHRRPSWCSVRRSRRRPV